MTVFRADLHCHTSCSDGSMSPVEIIHLAKELGLSAIAITDHDSIDAYQIALPTAQALNIDMITGIECSSVHHKMSVHILGYAYTPNSPILTDFCNRHHERRTQRNRDIMMRLATHNIIVTDEEISALPQQGIPQSQRTIGRPHIAQVMVQKGYVQSIQEAFRKYLADGECCYAPGQSVSAEETIDVIHQAGGVAIIAHPHLLQSNKLIKELLNLPFDGLEGYYARSSLELNQKWVAIAEKKGWLITGGSDFHGNIKPNIHLGCAWTNEETYNKLREHFQ